MKGRLDHMFENCSPYDFELEFYRKNNIPIWTCKRHKTKKLGKIYKSDDGSYVKAEVLPAPAQFWKFEIYCAESKEKYEVSTGSGGLENYFKTMTDIANNLVVVKEIK